jgi:hypothetical protein
MMSSEGTDRRARRPPPQLISTSIPLASYSSSSPFTPPSICLPSSARSELPSEPLPSPDPSARPSLPFLRTATVRSLLLPSFSIRLTSFPIVCTRLGHPVQPEDISSDVTEGKDSSQAAKGNTSSSNDASGPAKGEKVDGMPTPNANAEESAGDSSKPHYKCEGEDGGLVKPEDNQK